MSAALKDPYYRRLRIAAAVSVVVHLVVLVPVLNMPRTKGTQIMPEPILLNLAPEPQPQQARQQLAPAITPSDTPPRNAEFIAAENSRAAGQELRDGERLGPAVQEAAPLESLGAAPPASSPDARDAADRPQPSPRDQAPPRAKAEQAPAPEGNKARNAPAPEALATPAASDRDAPVVAEQDTPAPRQQPPAERMQVAQARPAQAATMQPAPPDEKLPPRPSRGRLNNRVGSKGLSSYEAIQDQIAPYLEEVKRRVERHWMEALLLRYSGTQPRQVEVDCEIAADGTLVSVRLAAPSEDAAYGALCMNAIREGAPFPRFPFEVPDIYRNQNLEIRWHFSFL
jgi:TonB family protein